MENNGKRRIVYGVILVIVVIVLLYFYNKNVVEAPIVDNNEIEAIDKTYIEGKYKNDLITFSIWPNSKVHGIVSYRGTIKGKPFFEGQMPVNVLDKDKKLIRASGVARAEENWWKMTANDAIAFEGNIDFSNLALGSAYIELHLDDNVEGIIDASILIPIIIVSSQSNTNNNTETYTYKNHGITMELPKGFNPVESELEGGNGTYITMPDGFFVYSTDANSYEKNISPQDVYIGTELKGGTNFKIYNECAHQICYPRYWFKQGNVGYWFGGNVEKQVETFKFVGWE